MKGLLLLGVLGVGSLSLTACGSSTAGGTGSVRTDALTFDNTTIPVAYVGEEFKANLMVSGGVGPYAYKVASGSLPPGMKYAGGVLSGTPTQAGAFKFTLEASDANLSNKVASYTLNVNELPPLSLEPTLPPGEIRGETRIPVLVKAPRAVRAARFTWDLGKDVQVTRVQAADAGSPVFWRQEGSVLSVDLGFKTVPRSGARVALVTVKPVKPATLTASNFWFESRDGTGRVLGEKKRPVPVVPPTATPVTTPTSTTPASTTPASTAPASPASGTPTGGTTDAGSGGRVTAPDTAPTTSTDKTTNTTTTNTTTDTATPPATPTQNPVQAPPEEKKP